MSDADDFFGIPSESIHVLIELGFVQSTTTTMNPNSLSDILDREINQTEHE